MNWNSFMMKIFVAIAVLFLAACGQTDREDSLQNTVALFVSNGLKLTPELIDEISEVALTVHSFDQLEQEFTALKNFKSLQPGICDSIIDAGAAVEDKKPKEIEAIKNRAVALQIVAYQNDWPVEDRFRFKPGELDCV